MELKLEFNSPADHASWEEFIMWLTRRFSLVPYNKTAF